VESTAAEGPTIRWGFIGSGQMAIALVSGMLRGGVAQAGEIAASDAADSARETFERATGVVPGSSNRGVAEQSDVLVLAVKPQAMTGVLEELRPLVGSGHLVVSIAAGVTLAALRSGLGPGCRLVRVMPNTPALIGAGAAAYCLDGSAGAADELLVRRCLESVGLALRVTEPLLDAVTGLSGSGPAYVYVMIEALSDGGVRMGLPRATATALAAQTVLGAARMVLETGQHPGVLKDQVTSPGGTTIAGLHALETGGLRGAVLDAVVAATRRSMDLSRAEGP
jgi:pyrroline-5-carboxylate reductase